LTIIDFQNSEEDKGCTEEDIMEEIDQQEIDKNMD